jgi:hypothetical protein
MMRRGLVVAWLAACAAAPALAQEPSISAELSGAAYDARLKESAAAAEGFQGPLDGGWTLSAAGRDLYAFQLVDDGRGGIEGAWRDLRKGADPDGSGFIDEVRKAGAEVTLRFADGHATAVLRSAANGRWTGELTEAGQTRAVSLKRRNP